MILEWTVELCAQIDEKDIAMKSVKLFKPGDTDKQKLRIVREQVSHAIACLDDCEYYGMTEEVEESIVKKVCELTKVPYARG